MCAKIVYVKGRGRAESLRLMMAAGGIEVGFCEENCGKRANLVDGRTGLYRYARGSGENPRQRHAAL